MTDDDARDIPPALSRDEWAAGTVPMPDTKASRMVRAQMTVGGLSIGGQALVRDVNDLAALIALANAAMNDEDPRKFRREHVELLRESAREIEDKASTGLVIFAHLTERYDKLHEFADALESYLPPETTT